MKKIGVNVVIANELIERRAILYSKIYPETHMICGDITNEKIFKKIVDESIDRGPRLATFLCALDREMVLKLLEV